MSEVRFFYDVGSPYTYLTAERIDSLVPGVVDWSPVSLGAMFKELGRNSWAVDDERRRKRGMEEIERRAHGYGLPPVRWPQPWPGNYLTAMRAATHAKRCGRERDFALTAFRRAFVHGQDLSNLDAVLDAATAAGLDRGAMSRAVADPAVKLALREATDAALELGARGVPTVAVDGELFWGDDRLEEAAARVAAAH